MAAIAEETDTTGILKQGAPTLAPLCKGRVDRRPEDDSTFSFFLAGFDEVEGLFRCGKRLHVSRESLEILFRQAAEIFDDIDHCAARHVEFRCEPGPKVVGDV